MYYVFLSFRIFTFQLIRVLLLGEYFASDLRKISDIIKYINILRIFLLICLDTVHLWYEYEFFYRRYVKVSMMVVIGWVFPTDYEIHDKKTLFWTMNRQMDDNRIFYLKISSSLPKFWFARVTLFSNKPERNAKNMLTNVYFTLHSFLSIICYIVQYDNVKNII